MEGRTSDMTYMLVDMVRDQMLSERMGGLPYAAFGPFETREAAEEFLSSHPYPDSFWIARSDQCR